MAVRARASVLFAAVCESLLGSFLLVLECVSVLSPKSFLFCLAGIISSLANSGELWEIVLRPKV